MDRIENEVSNNYSTLECVVCNVFRESLLSNYRSDIHTDIQADGRYLMKYANDSEMGSDAVIFVQIRSGIQNLMGRDMKTGRKEIA
jgi:hypothetical protein